MTQRREKRRRVITGSIIITWNETDHWVKVSNSGAVDRGRHGVLELLPRASPDTYHSERSLRVRDAPCAPTDTSKGVQSRAVSKACGSSVVYPRPSIMQSLLISGNCASHVWVNVSRGSRHYDTKRKGTCDHL